MSECAECVRLRAQLANAQEEHSSIVDDFLAAKRDAERDAARATVAEQDLREARRVLEGIGAAATRRRWLARAQLSRIAALAARGLERTR